MRYLALLALMLLTSCSAIRGWVTEHGKTAAIEYYHEELVPKAEQFVTDELSKRSPELLSAIDKNGDRIVQLEEVKGLNLSDPKALTGLGALASGLWAAWRAAKSNNNSDVNRLRQEVDELYDRTHAPVARQAT